MRSCCGHVTATYRSLSVANKHLNSGQKVRGSVITRATSGTMSKKEASVGHWESPITSQLIVSKSLGLSAPTLLPNGRTYFLEMRPGEQGRSVLVTRSAGQEDESDITPGVESGMNIRTLVHEYGGGDLLVTEKSVYFSNFKDQRVYVQDLNPEGTGASDPKPLTAEGTKLRFADYIMDTGHNRLIAVCEDHSEGGAEAKNTICAIDVTSGEVTHLVSGADFYHSPALSPDGRRLAWVEWDHPNMPWDDTRLVVGELGEEGRVESTRVVAGGGEESQQQPRWGPEGGLYFVSDRSGWWNLYKEEEEGKVVPLLPMSAEFGVPCWRFGVCTYAIIAGGSAILAVYNDPKAAGSQLGVIDVAAGTITPLKSDFTVFGKLSVVEGDTGDVISVLTTAGSASLPNQVTLLRVKGGVEGLLSSGPSDWTLIKASNNLQIDPGYFSRPSSIEFPTEGGLTAFMNYYPPANKDYTLPPGELPPLLVKIHGGPTGSASTLLNLSYQFWTSRGFAIADVNYGGSTVFGRAYRNRLQGTWGIVDVDDCCNAAKHLAGEGRVDPKCLCIDGGSAGGYTTLACLAFRDVFSAGASYFGVADAELLAQHTHKFESRYLDRLIGPYPQDKELYRQRSPLYSADKIKAPVALFQGDEDKVVPPEQSIQMYDAVKAKGLPTTLMMYKGEQHGFRKAENIRSSLEGEMFFYGKVLGFHAEYPGDLQPMSIDNLPVTATTT